MHLEVQQAKEHGVYRDAVRIPEAHRKDAKRRTLRGGSICWVAVNGRKTLAWIRGAKWGDPVATMDELLRRGIPVAVGDKVEIELRKATLVGEIRWGLQASEAAYRVATMLGLLSIAMGVLSTFMAFGWAGLAIAAAFTPILFELHYVWWRPRTPASEDQAA